MRINEKKLIKRTSTDSVLSLIDAAHDAHLKKNDARAKRYMQMAWELLKKNKVRLPKDHRNAFCRKCLTLWFPGETATVAYERKCHCLRIRCNNCGYTKRL